MIKKIAIKKILQASDLSGFSTPIVGKLQRYIVAFTHNENVTLKTLQAQIEYAMKNKYQNITIGGWRDSKTKKTYIDIGTSFASIRDAKMFGKVYQQIAIWDNVKMQEIRL